VAEVLKLNRVDLAVVAVVAVVAEVVILNTFGWD
jgi:hypothetical protein